MSEPVDEVMLLKLSLVRKYIKAKGKRVSPDFLRALNVHVNKKLEEACSVHNGGLKTLGTEVAILIGLK